MDAGEVIPAPATVLVSDADRDGVVELLKERTADGTLTLDDFANRIDGALTARTRGDLDALVTDLSTPAPSSAKRRKRRHWVLSVMAGAGLRGRWRCGDRVTAVAVMGGCHVDFRGAEIDAEEVHVVAVSIMGGIDIVVPEGIDVAMDGLPIMGGRSMHVKHVPTLPGSPRIVVHAFPIMGGVTVRSRPRRPVSEAPEIASTVAETRAVPAAALPLDGTVTIMFSDVCDYTGITHRLGDAAAHDLLTKHTRLLREHIRMHDGHEVKSNGDGFMVAFPSVARAVRCAVALQQSLREQDGGGTGETIRVHVGIHAGEVVRDGGDFLGSTVIVASRLADVAGPSEILVSSVAHALVEGSREFTFDTPRAVSLKGLVDAREAYPVIWQS